MNNTEANLNQQQPELIIKVKTNVSIPFDVEEDLEKYSRIYITKQFSPYIMRLIFANHACLSDPITFKNSKTLPVSTCVA